MLYYLLSNHPDWLGDPLGPRSLFFRAFLAVCVAAVVARIAVPATIRALLRRRLTEPTRDIKGLDPSSKKGTPIMGGLAILAALSAAVLLCCDFLNPFVVVVSGFGLAFGLIGFVDDCAKLGAKRRGVGLSEKQKYVVQTLLALLFVLLVLSEAYLPVTAPTPRAFYLPFCPLTWIPPSWLCLFLVPVFLIFTANAVNITDGLDGLVTFPVMLASGVLAVLACLQGFPAAAELFHFQPLAGSQELVVFFGAVLGACGAFLWFNAFPASIFMGDCGSLALGGILGTAAAVLGQELVFLVAGGLFVLEGLSSCLQSYLGVGLLGRRLFFRAPLHHDWLYQGDGEPKVVVRLWLVALFCGLVALLSLEFRR